MIAGPQHDRRARRWILPAVPRASAPSAELAAFASDLDIPVSIAAILRARGFTDPEAAHDFLHPSLSGLHDPMLLRDMDRALPRLLTAVRNREPIEIHGDYDVDGTTSTVLLKTAIELAGGTAGYWIPHRLKDGYGLREPAIERAAANGVKLIVSVDTGIRAARAVERARELGVDLIITDHHLPDAELPDAVAVINPNRPDCLYPEKNLCGAAVAFKLAQALLSTLGWSKAKLDRMLASLLKLVAIATIADVVPLTGENRIIVSYGLRGLTDVRSPGLRALLDASSVTPGRAPTPYQIGFAVGPRINAAGRMASASEVIELFLTADAARAKDIAGRLSALNSERQDEEARVLETIISAHEAAQLAQPNDLAAALVFAGEGWHRGVLGIVASRLAERFCRPCFVLGMEDGEAAGSGRSISAFHLLESLESLAAARGLFVKFGGHKQAAGVTLDATRVPEFREALGLYAAARLTAEDFEPVQRIDGFVPFKELNTDLWTALQMLEPFGMGNPAPVFAALDVEVTKEPVVMKEKHLRFACAQNGRVINFKAFNLAHRLDELAVGARIDIAFKLEADDYTGGWQAKISDFRPAAHLGSSIFISGQ